MYKTGVKRQIFFFPLQNCAAISVKFDRTESINFINQSTFKKKWKKWNSHHHFNINQYGQITFSTAKNVVFKGHTQFIHRRGLTPAGS